MNEIAELLKQHTDGVELKLENYKQLCDELGARVHSMEQKAARGGAGAVERMPTPGQSFVESDEVKSVLVSQSGGRRVGVNVKATITSATADADGSAGALTVPYRDMPVALPKRQLRVRDLLPVVQISSGSVEYPRVKTVTNGAATVAEGETKPSSGMQVELVTVPVRTIAHWMLASRQVLDDAPQLRDLIDTELLYGLGYVEEGQILNGAGTGTDLHGIFTQATAFSISAIPFYGADTTITQLDVLLHAILQTALADLPATGIVLHPSDWTAMRGLKDSEGRYILGEPSSVVEPRLFGLPVVPTKEMSSGSFLVGDFAGSATLYDRWEARVELSTEDGDNFRKNLVTLLAEERIGLAVKRTSGFVKATFDQAITTLAGN